MAEVLRAVQVARLRGQPARRISFRDIDVEQIGYIYEGLLGYTSAPAPQLTVGLIGKEGEEPEIPLATLEALMAANRTDAAWPARSSAGSRRTSPPPSRRPRRHWRSPFAKMRARRMPNGCCVP